MQPRWQRFFRHPQYFVCFVMFGFASLSIMMVATLHQEVGAHGSTSRDRVSQDLIRELFYSMPFDGEMEEHGSKMHFFCWWQTSEISCCRGKHVLVMHSGLLWSQMKNWAASSSSDVTVSFFKNYRSLLVVSAFLCKGGQVGMLDFPTSIRGSSPCHIQSEHKHRR